VCEDEVQHHEARLDVSVTLDAAVLRVWPFKGGIKGLRFQVIDMPAPTTLDDLNMVAPLRFAEHPIEGRTSITTGEAVVLTTQEVAGVYGNQIQK
jgi:hypothetical protein